MCVFTLGFVLLLSTCWGALQKCILCMWNKHFFLSPTHIPWQMHRQSNKQLQTGINVTLDCFPKRFIEILALLLQLCSRCSFARPLWLSSSKLTSHTSATNCHCCITSVSQMQHWRENMHFSRQCHKWNKNGFCKYFVINYVTKLLFDFVEAEIRNRTFFLFIIQWSDV